MGGDFYDVFESRDGGWAVVVGDVCGKGPEAAAVTGLARHTLRAGARARSTARAASWPSSTMRCATTRSPRELCTVAYARLDRVAGAASG